MENASLGATLVQAGLLVSILLVIRQVALHIVPLDELPALCRRRVQRQNPFCGPILALALLVTLVGVLMIGIG